ncbi:MAG: 3-phosphoshikimate 1-carboxyvinyltransferase [Rhodospirillaceae bacterium]|nr:3-phosphoshikimate 1-carboxyvinyltransferase [Rhodospirillaceae bacterium]MDD9998779.1 3-phosphoshikimate 1-carboxyvinyltransferase [Rhodospirillaceae bacterium]MDE0360619.1 3-phosphoshikimate 1-carboxyvinyltransferase [Rhodospirillaceae bacterium]
MSAVRQAFVVHPTQEVGGEVQVPGDKSISHRTALLSALAEGTSTARGFLPGDDCLATVAALRALGVELEVQDGDLQARGVGLDGLQASGRPLDLGNSGTGMRLLAGLLASQPFASELTGDESLRKRPMERVAKPLRAMGAEVETRSGKAPLRIVGRNPLQAVDYALPVASAQLKSALLLAGLRAHGQTVIRSPGRSRDHTERLLRSMGVTVESRLNEVVSVRAPQRLEPIDTEIPGDFSSAAFFLVAGLLAAPRGLLIRNVGVNPTRSGLLGIVKAMGGRVETRAQKILGGEPVADLWVSRSELRGIEVLPEWVPLAIDEFPILFVAAACARGTTVIRGAEELRYKESDRLGVMAEGLRRLGIDVVENSDGLVIEGGELHGGRLDAQGDHRIAMAFAIAGAAVREPIEILGTEQVSTSFPDFERIAAGCGLGIETATFGECA